MGSTLAVHHSPHMQPVAGQRVHQGCPMLALMGKGKVLVDSGDQKMDTPVCAPTVQVEKAESKFLIHAPLSSIKYFRFSL